MKKNILIFSYDGFHKKSEDLFFISKKEKLNIKIALLSPWRLIKKKNKFKGFNNITEKASLPISKILYNLNYKFKVCKHDDLEKIRKVIKKYKIDIGIIFGARILKKDVINLFNLGIINYHPGSLPQTSGLDSLYWTIFKNIKPVVTCHFIDGRVDAGKIVLRNNIKVKESDDISKIEKKLYISQLKLHKKVCKILNKGSLFKRQKIKNYLKNKPMTIIQKKKSIKMFNNWKKSNL